jgi:hypothetical protein
MRHEVVIPFSPPRTREILKIVEPTSGPRGAVYFAYDPADQSAFRRRLRACERKLIPQLVYIGYTYDMVGRSLQHLTPEWRYKYKRFGPDWPYRVAYPDQALADLIYPSALKAYTQHGGNVRKGKPWSYGPAAAAAKDLRVVTVIDGNHRGGVHHRLETLLQLWYKDQFGAVPRMNGWVTEYDPIVLAYLDDFQVRADGNSVIVSPKR